MTHLEVVAAPMYSSYEICREGYHIFKYPISMQDLYRVGQELICGLGFFRVTAVNVVEGDWRVHSTKN